MPSTHYQRVLEQDQQLWLPIRWLTRAMSSWWTVGLLAIPIVAYVYQAHYPIGGRFLWQHRTIDATQLQVVNWWPLQAAALTLALVVLWTAIRRLPMTLDSFGRYIAVIGLATVLVSQSWAFRYQTMGVAAVPLSETTATGQLDPLSLTYTTRFGDIEVRELVVMIGGTQPVAIPLNGLPRWNDAAAEQMPVLKLHDDPRLAGLLNFRVRITPVAYVADGSLDETEDGTQTVTPTPDDRRDMTNLPYPAKAMLAVRFEVDSDDEQTATTTVWVPFEPEGTDSLIAKRFYNIEGLGSVGLAFRPKASKLPFAIAASRPGLDKQSPQLDLYLADADSDGRLLQPAAIRLSSPGSTETSFRAADKDGHVSTHHLDWRNRLQGDQDRTLLVVSQNTSNPFIFGGMITFLLGVAIDFLLGWVGPKRKSTDTATT